MTTRRGSPSKYADQRWGRLFISREGAATIARKIADGMAPDIAILSTVGRDALASGLATMPAEVNTLAEVRDFLATRIPLDLTISLHTPTLALRDMVLCIPVAGADECPHCGQPACNWRVGELSPAGMDTNRLSEIITKHLAPQWAALEAEVDADD